MIDLKPGTDVPTMTENALGLMSEGMPKEQAMAAALNVAGYRPLKTTHPEKSSSEPPRKRTRKGSP